MPKKEGKMRIRAFPVSIPTYLEQYPLHSYLFICELYWYDNQTDDIGELCQLSR